MPVTLIVAPVTRAYFGDIPGHLSFSMKPGGRPPSKVISIPNGGIGTLTWTLTTTTFNAANFLTVSATSGTAPSVLTVGVNTANLPSGGAVAGTYTGQIQLQGAGDTVTIPVSIYVGTAEFEQINPLNFVKVFGGVDPLSQVITGATTGTAFTFTVSSSVGQGGSWLAVSPSGLCCTTPDAITVTVNPAVSLAVGTYTGHVNLSTAALSLTIRFLTPFSVGETLIVALMVTVAGFCGGAVMSAVKRDFGVKDFGGLIPGHGGMLDRVDSLCYAAPVFLHYVRWFHHL